MDRKLAPASIDEHRERDARGPAEVRELVERGAHRATGVQHVVDDHDALAIQIPGQLRRADDRARADGLQVVAIERDVERAARNLDLLAVIEDVGDADR